MKGYIANLAKGFQPNIVLCGAAGRGKTYLSIAAMIEYVQKRSSDMELEELRRKNLAAYATLNGILNDSRSFGDQDADKRLKRQTNAELLIVDELNSGMTTLTEHGRNQLFSLINDRYNNMRPTIFISNLNPDQLLQSLGESIISRIYQEGKNVLVFSGSNLRVSRGAYHG